MEPLCDRQFFSSLLYSPGPRTMSRAQKLFSEHLKAQSTGGCHGGGKGCIDEGIFEMKE